jgi:hypothetical protein
MAESPFDEGSKLRLKIVNQGESWYVKEPKVENEVACIFKNNEPSNERKSQIVNVQVVNYREAVGEGTDFVTVRKVLTSDDSDDESNQSIEQTTQTDDLSKRQTSINDSTSSTENKTDPGSSDQYPVRNLVKFDGSGDYVTTEAKILDIEFVEKNTDDMPDVRGVLGEDESIKKLPFVVTDETPHPYFEKGKRFRFEGVKDHKYEYKNETQALINEHTKIIELD